MDLRTQIDDKYKSAFKLKNIDEINTLRLIRNAIKNKDIETRSSNNKDLINDQQILNILQTSMHFQSYYTFILLTHFLYS